MARFNLLVAMIVLPGTMAICQQEPTMLQTPRQAVIEMLTGGPENLKKHLTVEVQAKLAASGQDSNYLTAASMASANPNFQSFETGPVLFAFDNPEQHERIEVRLDNDKVHGDSDEMDLSFRSFREGKEQSLPIGFRVSLGLKQQENVWRLSAITFSASLPVGDPRLYDAATWNPSIFGGIRPAGMGIDVPAAPVKMPPVRAARLIGLAENIYVQKHTHGGFTCNLVDLVNIGKGMDEGSSYSFIDPELGTGTYNGYRFTLTGCGSNPTWGYQLMAEPLNGTGKAYCSDATRVLRASDDGSGRTCLISGKPTNR